MSKRSLFITMVFLLLGFAVKADVVKSGQPNIVVILCDDLGYGDLECYGHPHIKTPHLNQLAQEGMRFSDFYSAAPVCSPSRVGLLTGRSPNRAGVYDWIPHGKEIHMRASEVTIPQLMKKAGYATCMSGKWHCNGKFNSSEQPQPGDAGFDHWFGTQNNASPSHENPINFVRNGNKVGPLEGYSCQLVVDEALTWLGEHRERNPQQPFFMYVAFHEPHEPVASPQNLVEGYMGVAENEDQAQYFANVENIDAAVGKLMAELKAQNIDQNTLVIFTSDNGPETLLRYGERAKRSYGSPDPLRGMKLWTTDAGFRVAGIMRWPAEIEAGQESAEAVSALDFLPTFCELAGTEPPTDLKLDGASFLPVFKEQPISRQKPLVWVYYHATNDRRVAMRDGDWKVLAKLSIEKCRGIDAENEQVAKGATLSDFQIFNVRKDIAEEKDLSLSHPDKLKELRQRLEVHYQELVKGSHVWRPEEKEVKIKTVEVSHSALQGIGVEEGIMRRDPSDVIKVGDLYYVWYSKGKISPGYDATVWYATSKDGRTWTEKGQAIAKGIPGTWEGASVFTPNILVAEGKYWLFYTGVSRPYKKGYNPDSKIGIAVSDSPDGPWEKLATNPALKNSDSPEDFDSHLVDDACLITRDGKYWFYYKGRQLGKSPSQTQMGLAIADKPEGPYIKVENSPVIPGCHEVLVWPQGKGVAAMIGPRAPKTIQHSILYAEDGMNFTKTHDVISHPWAAGAYRPEAFTNSGTGTMPEWGVEIGKQKGQLPFIGRFDVTVLEK